MCCVLGQLDARQTNRHANRARAAKENHMYAFLGAKARFYDYYYIVIITALGANGQITKESSRRHLISGRFGGRDVDDCSCFGVRERFAMAIIYIKCCNLACTSN